MLHASILLHTHCPSPCTLFVPHCRLTNADALIIHFSRSVAVVSQPAVLAVLAPGVVLAADACDDVQVVDVAAAVGVAVALTVYKVRQIDELTIKVNSCEKTVFSSQ